MWALLPPATLLRLNHVPYSHIILLPSLIFQTCFSFQPLRTITLYMSSIPAIRRLHVFLLPPVTDSNICLCILLLYILLRGSGKNCLPNVKKNAYEVHFFSETIYIIVIRVFCPRSGLSLQTQESRLQFCPKAGRPRQTQKPRLYFY